ncbi:MAG TPA: DUF1800 domain-containing protein [Candidatus Binataceae bacterium]|nr:DUF1800 domain-containing protein [Candidatus Binataceae bacterium]
MLTVGNMPQGKRALHALNRLGYGPRPGDLERVNQIGVERYIREQLDPESIAVPRELTSRIDALTTLHMTPVELFLNFQLPVRQAKGDADAQKAARQRSRLILQEAVEGRLIRAIYGPRQLQEVMTAFWFNHFNVFAGKGLCHLWVGAYEQEAIRPHTMGRFRALLGATAKHPAMLFYLDNWQNSAPNGAARRGKFEGINENYAREVMELHTLGVNGGYTQADVTALAHILTGWGLAKRGRGAMATGGAGMNGEGTRPGFAGGGMRRFIGGWPRRAAHRAPLPSSESDQYGFYFDPGRHDFSDQVFLGRTYSGGTGIAAGEQALDVLAHSPATARHLSRQLAQHFVADDPPQTLVARIADRYEASQGDIRATLEVLFFSPEFWDERCFAAKFKSPYEYVISAARAAGTTDITNFRPLFGTMMLLGMPPYGRETPDGYADTREAWLNPDAMMTRLSFATALGQGHLPLLAPPFEADGAAGGGDGGKGFRVSTKRGRNGSIMREISSPDAGAGRSGEAPMTPPDAAMLTAALDNNLSASTREAIEAAPAQLRAAMVLGSPEFMMR